MQAVEPIAELQFPGTREPVWLVVFVAVLGFAAAGVVSDAAFLPAALLILVGFGPAAAFSLFGWERVAVAPEAVTLERRVFSRRVWSERIRVSEIDSVYADYYGLRRRHRLMWPRYWFRLFTGFATGPVVIETHWQVYALGRGVENDRAEIERAAEVIATALQELGAPCRTSGSSRRD
jgi:hypothetical protein